MPQETADAPPVIDPPLPFGPGSMVWDEFGDTLNLALSGAGFILQAMHPMVSGATDRYSVFRTDPLGRAVRSFDSVMLWVYGGEEAIKEGRRLRELHKPIRGADGDGRRYSALNPEAYAFVHQTAFVTAVTAAPYTRGRAMTDAEQAQYYEEMLQLGDILQIKRKLMPPDVGAYWEYWRGIMDDVLEPTPVALELVERIRRTPVPFVPRGLRPLAWPAQRALAHVQHLLVFAALPEAARERLGVRWTAVHEGQLRAALSVIRPVHRRLPEQLRYVPFALHSRRRRRELDKMRGRATHSV